jgi:hypothetical protein
MKLAPATYTSSVQEWDDAFLSLWSHRYDYLWAEHPEVGERPQWQTESRYPLSDRLIQQGAFLYGVRFGTATTYFILDIDRTSIYHPARDRFAWRRIQAALESLGLVQSVLCTSSYSGGIHLYFPFDSEQKTWAIALAVTTLLENAGFKLAPGQLEVFPNCKPYSQSGQSSLYNGHRLPMQAGSYLLNEELEQVWGDQQTFVQQWQLAQRRNCVDDKVIEQTIKQARRAQYRITGKADKFLNDLNAEIELGWTGKGQTNRLLGRIAMRSYIFAHVLYTDTPLAGEALVQDVVRVARSLPGYEEWCQHQHEIEEKAQQWARSIEQSHYFHYGLDKAKPKQGQGNTSSPDPEPNWNQQQQEKARERVRRAIADLLEKGSLPTGTKARFDALVSYNISGKTLYKHRDLWHPKHLQNATIDKPQQGMEQGCSEGAPCSEYPTNLLEENGCNRPYAKDSSDRASEDKAGEGCNNLSGQNLSSSQPKEMTQAEGIAYVKQMLNKIQKRQQAEKFRKLIE